MNRHGFSVALLSAVITGACGTAYVPASFDQLRVGEATAVPSDSDSASAQSAWRPPVRLVGILHGDQAAIQSQQRLILGGELFRALNSHAALGMPFPQDLEALQRTRLLMHVPLDAAGSPKSQVQLMPGENPNPDEVGYRFSDTATEIILPVIQADGSQGYWRQAFEHDLFSTGRASAPSRQSPASLAIDYFQRGGVQRLAPDPADPPHLANYYLFHSDNLNEQRLLKLHATVKLLTLNFVRTHGKLPASWDEVLETFQIAPVNYKPINPASQLSVGAINMMYQAEANHADHQLRCYLKPTLPAFDRFLFEYHLRPSTSQVEVQEHIQQPANDGFRAILKALIPHDPVPELSAGDPVQATEDAPALQRANSNDH